jgi:hypothetical protein
MDACAAAAGDMASEAVTPMAGDNREAEPEAEAGEDARAAGSGDKHTLSMSALTSVQSAAMVEAADEGDEAAVTDDAFRATGDCVAIAAAALLMVRSGVRAGDFAETTTMLCGRQKGGWVSRRWERDKRVRVRCQMIRRCT